MLQGSRTAFRHPFHIANGSCAGSLRPTRLMPRPETFRGTIRRGCCRPASSQGPTSLVSSRSACAWAYRACVALTLFMRCPKWKFGTETWTPTLTFLPSNVDLKTVRISVLRGKPDLRQEFTTRCRDLLPRQFRLLFEHLVFRTFIYPRIRLNCIIRLRQRALHIDRLRQWKSRIVTQVHLRQPIAVFGTTQIEFAFIQPDLHLQHVVLGFHPMPAGLFHRAHCSLSLSEIAEIQGLFIQKCTNGKSRLKME